MGAWGFFISPLGKHVFFISPVSTFPSPRVPGVSCKSPLCKHVSGICRTFWGWWQNAICKRLQLLLDYNIYLVQFFLTPNLCWIPELRIVCLCHPVVFHLLNGMIGGSSFGCQGQTCGLSSNGYIGRMLYARKVNQDHHECICSYLFS